MKKIITSLGMIVFAAAIVVGGTGAFFSDTETSTANVFTAGALDLTVDSVGHINGLVCFDGAWHPEGVVEWNAEAQMNVLVQGADVPAAVAEYNADFPSNVPAAGTPCASTWTMTDLGPENVFFDFDDLKPGDNGENTISLHVDDNDAYLCAAIHNVSSDDNGITEPEEEAGDGTDGPGNGELHEELEFIIWEDNGDNILDTAEVAGILYEGLASEGVAGVYPLYTPATGVFEGGTTQYLGVYWCYGDLVRVNNLLTCDGAPVTNMTQTDSLEASITFYIEQARNNSGFECPDIDEFEVVEPGPVRPVVGAVLGDYQAPTCDITVDGEVVGDLDTIQEGVDAAVAGQTVCVDAGTYAGPIEVNEDVTLVSVGGPGVTTINGGVKITASGATVKGFTVNAGIVPAEPNPVGFYVASGDNILIDTNEINGVANSSGVLFVTGATYNNVVVTNNEISGHNVGIYTNPHTGNIDITYNDIFDNNAGIGGLTGATVRYNEFNHTAPTQEAIGVDGTFDSNVATVNFNNFLNGTMLNDYGAVAIINAENNFWNLGGVNQTTAGHVDFTPEEVSAFPQNI